MLTSIIKIFVKKIKDMYVLYEKYQFFKKLNA